jgi:SPP1 gp7 family putative phage head morphogenesis protein
VWGYAARTLTEKTGFALTAAYDLAKTAAQAADIPSAATVAGAVRTNLATAHNASKLFAMAKNAKDVPGWQFLAVRPDADPDATPECTALHEKIFSNQDRKNFPPIHFNCRSMGVPILKDEWEAEGLEAGTTDVELPEGFENTAVRDYEAWVEKQMAENGSISQIIKARSKE